MKLIVNSFGDCMKSINSVKLTDAEYWILKKKMVELECLTWRELLLKLSDIADHKVERGVLVEVKERPLVVPALDIVEEGEAEKPKTPLVKGIKIMRGKTLKIREGKKVVIKK